MTEAERALLEAGWRSDMENAPRDGTVIDVWREEGGRETVYWGLRPHTCGEMGQHCDSDWHSEKTPDWVCSTFGEYVGGKHNPFTHWKPLDTPDTPDPAALLIADLIGEVERLREGYTLAKMGLGAGSMMASGVDEAAALLRRYARRPEGERAELIKRLGDPTIHPITLEAAAMLESDALLEAAAPLEAENADLRAELAAVRAARAGIEFALKHWPEAGAKRELVRTLATLATPADPYASLRAQIEAKIAQYPRPVSGVNIVIRDTWCEALALLPARTEGGEP